MKMRSSTLALLAAFCCPLSGCSTPRPQSLEEFEHVYEKAKKRSEAQYRRYERVLEKARARDAARQN